MKKEDEGVIKYDQSNYTFISSIPHYEYTVIEKYRKVLNRLNLVSAYDNGFGFGNISHKKNYQQLHATQKPQFIITGSQTGHLPDLDGTHYARVLDFHIEDFSLVSNGAVQASSETMSHAAIYQQNPNIGAIIHFHNLDIWKELIKSDTTSINKWIEYGTYEMAMAVRECVGNKTQGIFVMMGHEEGVIAYGPNLSTALQIVTTAYTKCTDNKSLLRKLL